MNDLSNGWKLIEVNMIQYSLAYRMYTKPERGVALVPNEHLESPWEFSNKFYVNTI